MTTLFAENACGLSVCGSRLRTVAVRISTAQGWHRRGMAMLLGILAALALPPLYVLPVLWVSFPGLVWLLDGAGRQRRAFADGWWFGFGHFSAGLYWIAYALLVDPVRFGWMVPFAVCGLGGLLGVFTGTATWVAFRWSRPGLARIALLAAAWVFLEWVRSWILTGFPWNLLGSVWLVWLPVAQFAAIAGSYGLSLLTVLVGAAPALLLDPRRLHRLAAPGILILLLAIGAWGTVRLHGGPLPSVPGVRLRLVQANIEQTLKWNPEMLAQHFRLHLELTQSAGWDKITDVIWPETATPYLLDEDAVARRLIAQVTPPGGLLITGALRRTGPGVKPFRIWNSLQAVDGQGEVVGTYDKAHLVPFGEYVPLHDVLPLARLTAVAQDISAGPGVSSIDLPGLPTAGPLICYEVIFPGEVVDKAHRPAWLLNVTNDGWFGISAGPHQHFAAARLRAIEEGVPLVRAANTGISAVVDSFGRVAAELPLGTQGVLDADLPKAFPGILSYARYGNTVPLILVLVVAFCAVMASRGTREG
ncbi:apolipoprotein N-acyltransferase [Telmatospirillum sp.]|uniref:apolipoprotein N-acyltransferase n=1 Tax=Telmatospirillum sp. TaxID=2079197 RepID=UPI002844BA55|nr:apolipoprotein N-acyltransferase [Telmatospirillum sp.]MDR3440424.1 apolipoprotein N-acyltransferase [Telmatospirillum sp.]